MEYLRTNNLQTAILSLQQAKEINPTDPMIYNELGVIAYKQKRYNEAKEVGICGKASIFSAPWPYAKTPIIRSGNRHCKIWGTLFASSGTTKTQSKSLRNAYK